jgi:hypothetical protein
MPTIRIELDSDSFIRLAAIAVEARRAIPAQVEVLVLQAIGVWPHPPLSSGLSTPATPEALPRLADDRVPE